MTKTVSGKRVTKAIAITAALILSVPAVGAIADPDDAAAIPELRRGSVSGFRQSQHAGIDASDLIGDGSAFGFLSRLEEASASEKTFMSETFKQEVGMPHAYRDFRASDDGTVASCLVDAPSGSVSDDVLLQMIGKGWSDIPLGSIEGATYVKAGGRYTWMLVTCTQVGEATNVVYRSVFR